MPRILFNMPSQFADRPSGVARVAFELLHQFVGNSDFECILRSPWSEQQLPAFLQGRPLKVVVTRRPTVLVVDIIKQALTFRSFCKRENIDLVVNLDPYGAATGGKARLMIVHDLYFKSIPQQIGRRARLTNEVIFRLMLGGNFNIVTISKATQTDLEHYYPQTTGRVTTIHSATSLRPEQDQHDAPMVTGRYVMAVGNATDNKNFRALGAAMAIVHSSDPEVALVHVGNDPSETLAHSLKQLNSPVRVIRFSGIDDGQLANLYRHASCLCVPSVYEGFCLPILEAQICGCPVVCSNSSAMPEIAGKGAILVDATSPAALAGGLKSVIDDRATADSLIQAGYENTSHFSWEKAAHQYRDLFMRVLAER